MKLTNMLVLLAVIGLAAGTRCLFLHELRQDSYLGNTRVSDARTYHEEAQRRATGAREEAKAFWQAPLYPFGLSLYYRLLGGGLPASQILHVMLGATVCVVLFVVTCRLFDVTTGCVASVLAALYAPFWLFDIQELPASLTIVFYLLEVLLLGSFLRSRRRLALGATGLLHGACIITHGLAIFATPALAYVVWRSASLPGTPRMRSAVASVALFLSLAVLPPICVSARNSLVEKAFVFTSYNAGINLFIGSHPDYPEKIGLRNGIEWKMLFTEWRRDVKPALPAGASTPAAMNRYFSRRAAQNFMDHPVGVLRTKLHQAVLVFSGTELSRNFPIEPLRGHSLLLRVMLWQVAIGGLVLLAFPTGLLLPAAMAGVCARAGDMQATDTQRLLRALPVLMACLHVLGMVLFFPCTRYRAPAMALLIPYAALFLVALVRCARGGGRLPACSWVTGAAALLVCNAVSSSLSPLDPVKLRAEHLFNQGSWYAARGEPERAAATWEEAHAIDPVYTEPLAYLGDHYLRKMDGARALQYYNELGAIFPEVPGLESRLRHATALKDALERRAAGQP